MALIGKIRNHFAHTILDPRTTFDHPEVRDFCDALTSAKREKPMQTLLNYLYGPNAPRTRRTYFEEAIISIAAELETVRREEQQKERRVPQWEDIFKRRAVLVQALRELEKEFLLERFERSRGEEPRRKE